MIKASIKNFFKSLGFYFIPLGVMAFCLMICLSITIPHMIGVVKGAYQSISTSIGQTSFDWNAIQSALIAKFMEYASDIGKAMALISSPEGIVNLLKEIAMETFGLESLTNEIVATLENAVIEVMSDLVAIFASLVIGLFLGFIFLKIIIRRYLANTNMFKAFLISIVDALVFTGVMILLSYLKVNNEVWMWVTIALVVLGVLLISQFEAYLFYGVGKVKFLKVVNIKNTITLLIGDLIDIIFGIGVSVAIYLTMNPITAILVIIPFAMLIVCILGINAETYTSQLVFENKIDKRIDKEIEKRSIEQ
ncbi:MAG: hypothetical protein E7175_03470 [Erysipelotrichaceae bacterium]|nr:hypothetical protein [Erysipelotrichaceae bacterium]